MVLDGGVAFFRNRIEIQLGLINDTISIDLVLAKECQCTKKIFSQPTHTSCRCCTVDLVDDGAEWWPIGCSSATLVIRVEVAGLWQLC